MSAYARHPATTIAGMGLTATLLLGACSAGASSAGAPGSAAAGSAAAGPAAGGRPAKEPASSPALLHLQSQKLVRTATLEVGVDDIGSRAGDVRRIAVQAGGAVIAEEISAVGSPPAPFAPAPSAPPEKPLQPTPLPQTPLTPTPLPGGSSPDSSPPGSGASPGDGAPVGGGRSSGTVAPRYDRGLLTIAVPAARLDPVLDQLSQLGSVTRRSSSSQDVTSTYVDTQSRLATMRSSIDRLRALMAQTTAIDQIVTLESELSRRLSDLESLQAQLAALDAQVTLSTVSVTLAAGVARTPGTGQGSGFLAGLRQGWTTFVDVLVAVLTVLGAALPFLGAVAVLAVPGVMWWRRRTRTPRELHPSPLPVPRTCEPQAEATKQQE